MQYLILFLIVGTLVAIAYFYLQSRKQGGAGASPQTTTRALKIQNVRPGGVISLKGAGPEMEDFDVVVEARHVYEEDGFEWFELEGMKGNAKVWIEVEEDDELEVSLCGRKLSLADLGLSAEDLERMERADEGTITFEGVAYTYEDWGKARFFRNGQRTTQGEKLKYWDFESADETQFLSIESWGGGHYEVYLSESLRPSQIEVFTTEG